MNRATTLVLVATLLHSCAWVPRTSAKYVLHVVADDLGYDDVGWYVILYLASGLCLSLVHCIPPIRFCISCIYVVLYCINVSCRRNHQAHTPTLDHLVAHGIEIPEFYTYMMCAPARGSTLSGRYPMRLGLYDNNQA